MSDRSDHDDPSEEHMLYGDDNDDMSTQDDDHDSEAESINNFLDLEASEDGSESGAESGADVGSQTDDDDDDDDEPWLFHQYQKLPVELRRLIWETFCPDLTAKSRVFELRGIFDSTRLWEGPILEQQTAPARTVLAIDRDTRAFALRSLPDSFQIGRGNGTIRFNCDKDVIFFNRSPIMHTSASPADFDQRLLGLNKTVQNIAIPDGTFSNYFLDYNDTDDEYEQWSRLVCAGLPHFPKLKKLYLVHDSERFATKDMRWTASHQIHNYHVQTVEEAPGLGEDLQMIYCYPDLEKPEHRDFAEREITDSQTDGDLMKFTTSCRSAIADTAGLQQYRVREGLRFLNDVPMPQGVEVWPMVQFNFDSGVEHLNDIKAYDQPWDEYVSDNGTSGTESENEYESDGIDDGPLDDDNSSSDDDDDDLAVQPLTSDVSDFDGFSPEPESATIDLTEDIDSEYPQALFSSPEPDSGIENVHPTAQFSSPEPESQDDDEAITAGRSSRRVVAPDSEDESVTETEVPARMTNRNARSLLADSDDESEAEDVPSQLATVTSRRNQVVLSDSEDESEAEGDAPQHPALGTNRRGRVILSDSQDESQAEDDAPQHPAPGTNRRGPVILSDSEDDSGAELDAPQPSRGATRRTRALPSDSEDDEEDGGARAQVINVISSEEEEESSGEDEEQVAPRPMSIFEQLAMHRDEHPGPPSSDNSEAGDMDGNDYDAEHFDDDDEDVSEKDEMAMGMADEFDSGEEEW